MSDVAFMFGGRVGIQELIPIIIPVLIIYSLWYLPWKKWRQNVKSGQHEAFPEVRPEVRFFARLFDYALFGLITGTIFGFTAPSMFDMPNKILLSMIIVFIWVFVEASLLSSWGTTPGKWLLRITLVDSAGQKLNFSNALLRCFSVWGKGVGIGFPVVNLIAFHFSYKKLTQQGVTTWDSKGGFVVSHEKIGKLRVLLTVLFFIGFYLMRVSEQLNSSVP